MIRGIIFAVFSVLALLGQIFSDLPKEDSYFLLLLWAIFLVGSMVCFEISDLEEKLK